MDEELEAAIDDMLDPKQPTTFPNDPLRKRGSGWTPGLQMTSNTEGTITSGVVPAERDVTWDSILREWGLDPEVFEVLDDTVLMNTWDAPSADGPVRMRQYKGRVTKRNSTGVNIDELVEMIRKQRPKKRATQTGPGTFMVSLSDLQLGKGEGGGTRKIVERFMFMLDAVEHRIKELRRLKRPLDELVILLPGDTVEGCDGWYAMQTFSVDLDNREQARVARALLTKAILRWGPLFDRVRVAGVAGNHGEKRKKGKAYTSFTDNTDLEVIEGVAEAFRLAERTGVDFILGNGPDPLTAILEVNGWSYGMIHGHVTGPGATPEAKVYNWYKSMSAQKQPIGHVDCLVTGHFHHYRAADLGGLWFMQSPSLDGGSEWYAATGGGWSDPGMLTWAVYPDQRCTDIQLLGCPPELRGISTRWSG